MSKRQAIGGRILAAREASGLSLWRAARRLGVAPWALQGWEHGRADVPLDVRQGMAVLYGTAPHYLVPERPAAVLQDGTDAVVRIGSVAFTLDGSDDQSLRRFLAAVREERGLEPGATMAVRESDAAFLADLLGGTAADIAANLARLLGVSDEEAAEFSDWLFGRTTVGAVLTLDLTPHAEGPPRPPPAEHPSAVPVAGSDVGLAAWSGIQHLEDGNEATHEVGVLDSGPLPSTGGPASPTTSPSGSSPTAPSTA